MFSLISLRFLYIQMMIKECKELIRQKHMHMEQKKSSKSKRRDQMQQYNKAIVKSD